VVLGGGVVLLVDVVLLAVVVLLVVVEDGAVLLPIAMPPLRVNADRPLRLVVVPLRRSVFRRPSLLAFGTFALGTPSGGGVSE